MMASTRLHTLPMVFPVVHAPCLPIVPMGIVGTTIGGCSRKGAVLSIAVSIGQSRCTAPMQAEITRGNTSLIGLMYLSQLLRPHCLRELLILWNPHIY